MTEQAKKPVSIGLVTYHTHSLVSAPPVAILNEESSTKDRLIYCERIAAQLGLIADLGGDSETEGVRTLANAFLDQLYALQQLLESLVSECEKAGAES